MIYLLQHAYQTIHHIIVAHALKLMGAWTVAMVNMVPPVDFVHGDASSCMMVAGAT